MLQKCYGALMLQLLLPMFCCNKSPNNKNPKIIKTQTKRKKKKMFMKSFISTKIKAQQFHPPKNKIPRKNRVTFCETEEEEENPNKKKVPKQESKLTQALD